MWPSFGCGSSSRTSALAQKVEPRVVLSRNQFFVHKVICSKSLQTATRSWVNGGHAMQTVRLVPVKRQSALSKK
jgi:hypothetical protein